MDLAALAAGSNAISVPKIGNTQTLARAQRIQNTVSEEASEIAVAGQPGPLSADALKALLEELSKDQEALSDPLQALVDGVIDPEAEAGGSVLDQELTPEEEQEVQDLKQRDQEVRQHEQAHKTAGGPYAGAPQYDTVTGPDGREYAVGGEVKIDASPIQGNPEATIRKMDIVIRAALAPAEPSSQDFQVARAAQAARSAAQAELLKQNAEETQGDAASPLDEAIAAYTQSEAQDPQSDVTKLLSAINIAA